MTKNLIYFDSAATSFPKPTSVYVAHDEYLRNAGNPGRGAHQLAFNSARWIFEARSQVAQFLGAEKSEHLIFTPGCTQSINMVLRGMRLPQGACVLVGPLEHNAVMRTLQDVQKKLDLKIIHVPYAKTGIVDERELARLIDEAKPALCIFAEASNVTGEHLRTEAIAAVCADRAVPLLVDAAQTAGSESDCLRHAGISFWAAPGHKGLFGAPGVGLLFSRDSQGLDPFVFGGTGSGSENLSMPQDLPDRLEPGTLPGPAIAALGAGVEFIREIGVRTIAEHEHALAQRFREWCFSKSWIEVAGNAFANKRLPVQSEVSPVVSFQMDRLTPDRVADILASEFSIAVRSGLHCASRAHETLGTLKQGLVRVSFGYFNTEEELEALCDALEFMNR
jgi:cysteine desulfurase family protein